MQHICGFGKGRRCNFTDEQREREQERNRERRQNFSAEQRGKEQERERERRQNFTEEQLENEREREQEKIDAELATSGKEWSEKQQNKNGVD